VDTAKNKGGGLLKRLKFMLRSMSLLLFAIPRAESVGLHTTNTSLVRLGLPLAIVCKLLRKPFVLRKFGGPVHDELPASSSPPSRIHRWLADTTIRAADLVLLETQYAVEAARQRGARARWFANSRPMENAAQQVTLRFRRPKRFVYLGHVKESKGTEALKQIWSSLPADYTLDIYGPVYDEGSVQELFSMPNVTYRGAVRPQEATALLSHYRALVLPTRHPGEGQPGVILEAFAACTPVIASRWGGIPELVNDCETGLLCNPSDPNAFREAIVRLANDRQLYGKMQRNIARQRKSFDSITAARRYVHLLDRLFPSKYGCEEMSRIA